MADVQEVEAKILETDLADPTKYDRWIAGIREEVQGQLSNFGPHEITSVDDYKQSGNERKAARAIINKWDGQRKEATARYRKLLSDIKDDVDAALQPLKDADAGYKAARDEWERLTVDSRTQEVAAWYAETQGDVAAMVPFETVWARYAHAEKWDLYGANLVQVEQGVAGVVESIEQDMRTLDSAPYAEEDKANVKAEYLRTLDLSGALRSADEARRRRERMAEVERQRRERMAAEAAPVPATDAHEGRQDAASAPEAPTTKQAPTAADAEPQEAAGGAGTVTFCVEMPAGLARGFIQRMREMGAVHCRVMR